MKDFFSNRHIYNAIVTLRLSLVGKRKKLHSDREISVHPSTKFFHKPAYKGESLLEKILPPRRTWVSAGLERRKNVLLNSQTRIRFALVTTYEKALNEKDKPDWLLAFENFCEEVRIKTENISEVGFDSPTLFAIEKKRHPSRVEYRPIVQYSLTDRVIIGLSAKYFVNKFDSEFYENSFAFRKPRVGKAVTHNTAFEKIMEYKKNNRDKEIFVAECDIKKFYDCINHKIVIDKLLLLTDRLNKNDIRFDPNAVSLLNKYLESFSFYNNIHKPCDPKWFVEKGLSDVGFFGWELDGLSKEFEYGFDPTSTSFFPIGVPQGGALSCIISNIVLDYVDRKVMLSDDGDVIDKDLLYLRYCDDMIILHTDRGKCAEALERYKCAIKECKLLVHETSDLFFDQKYSKEFWDKKAKPVYKWGQATKKEKHSVPWLSFVGYQLRYDFQIRSRNSSVIKHNEKLKTEYNRINNIIYDKKTKTHSHEHMRVLKGSILGMFSRRLISLSVGRPTLYNLYHKSYELCWANGFRLLIERNNIAALQLRRFDQKRGELVYKLNKKIPSPPDKKLLSDPNTRKKFLKKLYTGTPFSYFGMLMSKDKDV